MGACPSVAGAIFITYALDLLRRMALGDEKDPPYFSRWAV